MIKKKLSIQKRNLFFVIAFLLFGKKGEKGGKAGKSLKLLRLQKDVKKGMKK